MTSCLTAFSISETETYSLSVWATRIEPGPQMALRGKLSSLGASLPNETGLDSIPLTEWKYSCGVSPPKAWITVPVGQALSSFSWMLESVLKVVLK